MKGIRITKNYKKEVFFFEFLNILFLRSEQNMLFVVFLAFTDIKEIERNLKEIIRRNFSKKK